MQPQMANHQQKAPVFSQEVIESSVEQESDQEQVSSRKVSPPPKQVSKPVKAAPTSQKAAPVKKAAPQTAPTP